MVGRVSCHPWVHSPSALGGPYSRSPIAFFFPHFATITVRLCCLLSKDQYRMTVMCLSRGATKNHELGTLITQDKAKPLLEHYSPPPALGLQLQLSCTVGDRAKITLVRVNPLQQANFQDPGICPPSIQGLEAIRLPVLYHVVRREHLPIHNDIAPRWQTLNSSDRTTNIENRVVVGESRRLQRASQDDCFTFNP